MKRFVIFIFFSDDLVTSLQMSIVLGHNLLFYLLIQFLQLHPGRRHHLSHPHHQRNRNVGLHFARLFTAKTAYNLTLRFSSHGSDATGGMPILQDLDLFQATLKLDNKLGKCTVEVQACVAVETINLN